MRWVAILPFGSVEASIQEMHLAKEEGACGLFFLGMAGERSLADPYLFPIYEEASKLNLPVCMHTGPGNPVLNNVFDFQMSGLFLSSSSLPIVGFRDIILNRVPERFPDLRFGIFEAGASWVPHALYTMMRQFGVDAEGWGPRLFEENRFFIACEEEEDIPYLVSFIGEDHLMMGFDYGHTDVARDAQMIAKMTERTDLSKSAIEKALGSNAQFFTIFKATGG
jgi:predicted TIM-barrel fold metal-dependent hydrolase